MLNTERSIDLFTPLDRNALNDYDYDYNKEYYYKFLKLQSLMSKFLIKKMDKIMKINNWY